VAERLQKLLAGAGLGSRRACEALILEGRVQVNGEAVTALGTRAEATDDIRVDGEPIATPSRKTYLLLNKPANVITTASDPFGRRTVLDLLAGAGLPRVFPVGRLDYATRGLLLLTNDGAYTQRVAHPSGGAEKLYEALVTPAPEEAQLERLRSGVLLDDGFTTSPARVRRGALSSPSPSPSQNAYPSLLLAIREGHNREVRRMLFAVGLKTLQLTRVAIGGLTLAGVPEGAWRELSAAEADQAFEPIPQPWH